MAYWPMRRKARPGPTTSSSTKSFQKHGVEPRAIDDKVTSTLMSAGVEVPVARASHTAVSKISYGKRWRFRASICPSRHEDPRLLQNRAVQRHSQIPASAGYGGGYLFIDDIENLVDQIARRERIEFAKEFRTLHGQTWVSEHRVPFLFQRPHYAQQASVSLSQAWGEAGLAAIGKTGPSIAELSGTPVPERGRGQGWILRTWTTFASIQRTLGASSRSHETEWTPFWLGQTVHPRATLSNAAKVMQHAADTGVRAIDAECVKAASESDSQIATPDFTEGINGAL